MWLMLMERDRKKSLKFPLHQIEWVGNDDNGDETRPHALLLCILVLCLPILGRK